MQTVVDEHSLQFRRGVEQGTQRLARSASISGMKPVLHKVQS